MAAWKGKRKNGPYEDLKWHIETKIRNEMAHNRYFLKQGTLESRGTRSEKAPPKRSTVTS
ncbi:hypothetical protein P3T76_013713 [Phytophthora citrophthora]|uniref:Uncharacterized protein n=1 Tax=Phytophthora citrophthora TaxID=4793 RepID=A0AAD9LBW2_9STRA|nr:hypothetical protein P3T76_013713 [Phytophthora citrophthora]